MIMVLPDYASTNDCSLKVFDASFVFTAVFCSELFIGSLKRQLLDIKNLCQSVPRSLGLPAQK